MKNFVEYKEPNCIVKMWWTVKYAFQSLYKFRKADKK